MKRFSWLAFAVATVVHICGTLSLLQASFSADKLGQRFLWITVWSWIWWPLPRLIWTVSQLQLLLPGYEGPLLLIWSLCVGTLFGFIVPRFSIWRRQMI